MASEAWGKGQRGQGEAGDPRLVDGLVQLSFAVQAILGRIAAGYDLSIIQVRLLGLLREREPAMIEVATALNLDKSSVSGLVDRAERRGLVRRTTTEEDRRAVHVVLTERGRELAKAFAKEVERDLDALVQTLDVADRSQLARLAHAVASDHARLPATHGAAGVDEAEPSTRRAQQPVGALDRR